MPELSAPGVYIEEIPAGPQGIVGVPTSTAAFVGFTAKGPINQAKAVDSLVAFRETFGTATAKVPLALAVGQFFDNGGKRAVIVRTKGRRSGRQMVADPKQIIGDGNERTGLHALDESESLGLLLTPDVATMTARDANAVARAVLQFCKTRRMFHILELPEGVSKQGSAQKAAEWAGRHGFLRQADAAAYFPNLVIPDPAGGGATVSVSPSGAVAGVYARLDGARGVWKSPAGLDASLRNVADVACDCGQREIALLQAASINPIARMARQGVVIWGARTFLDAKNDSEWRYVPVRRVALLIEESVHRGLRWAVFEPNGESLWAQIRLVVSSFMHQLFRSGAFQGVAPAEAYFVKCGRDTMTQADIEHDRIVLDIGFAPLKPAEFVILKVTLITACGGGPQ